MYIKYDILHIIASTVKPTTLGKIEKLKKSYRMLKDQDSKENEQFIKYYDNKRPHILFNYMTSVQVYDRNVTFVAG
ncbi:MAG: hypothetical protein ACPKQO_02170 [Nitrososphaeraceae archaeon]